MDVVRMLVGRLVRRGWKATVILSVLVGLAAGVAMAATAAGRRTATAFDRFEAYADPADLLVQVCPAGSDEVSEQAIEECLFYDPAEEQEVVSDLPEVEGASRGSFRGVTAASPGQPATAVPAGALVLLDPGLPSAEGRQLLVDGRRAADAAVDEIVVNERFRDRTGHDVGDQVVLSFWSPDEVGSPGEPGRPFRGPSITVRIVGIVRGLTDLGAASADNSLIEDLRIQAGPGVGAVTAEAGGFRAMLVEASDAGPEAARQAIEAAFPDRVVNVQPARGPDETEPTREAIRYEARGVLAVGILAGAAGAIFIGQAVARQSRREWDDLERLRSLGVTSRQVGMAAALRGAMIALPGAALAAGTATALSPLGPVGVGRTAETDPGIHVDGLVVAVGVLLLLAVVVVSAWIPVAHQRGAAPDRAATARPRLVRGRWLPPALRAGVDMGRGVRRGGTGLPAGTALAGAALAIGMVVAAAGLTASLDDLLASPERFGAPWDLSISTSETESQRVGRAMSSVRADADIEAAAIIVGTDVTVGDETVWVQAFEPLEGVERSIGATISGGRPPVDHTEIALGSITMEDLDVSLGDAVEVQTPNTGLSSRLTVVGTAIINDSFEKSPGRGGVVASAWISEFAPELTGDPLVIRLSEGSDVAGFATEVRERYGYEVRGPVPHEAILNVSRIRELPYVLAAIVAGLAVASLLHVLVLSVRRQHGQLAILKALGFTRPQVGLAVAGHATSLSVLAAVAGLPLGIMLGRWGWRAVADQVGVPAVPVTPALAVLMAGALALVVANVAAAYPAWRAARLPTAEVLRTE